MMTLGQRIMQLRMAAGLSQEALGAALDTTRQTVSRWELDQALPTLDRIVRLSRLFGVTTDSLLLDGISTFNHQVPFACGVFRGADTEIVETERFAYMLQATSTALEARLYRGAPGERRLLAVCQRDLAAERTGYAFRREDGSICTNDDTLAATLGQPYNENLRGRLHRRERFRVDHSGTSLPTVQQAGIRRSLMVWRMADSLDIAEDRLQFFLCTGQTEYVMNICQQDADIYCGASFNIPFDMGLFGGGQYFRLRNAGDNSAPWCGFWADFTRMPEDTEIPTSECQLGQCVASSRGLIWCLKRWSNDEIVLQGCGDDEYIYRRQGRRDEQFLPE